MAAPKLFATVQEIKDNCSLISGSATFINTTGSDMDGAMYESIAPVLGDTLLANLITAYQAASYVQANMSAPYKNLLPVVQAALSPLGNMRYLAKNMVTSKDGGLTAEADVNTGRIPISLWMYNKLKTQLQADGDNAIDRLWKFLDSSTPGTYPTWEASSSYSKFKSFFIGDMDTFNELFNIDQSVRTFIRLRPAMKDVEQLTIQKQISPQLFAALKTKITNRTSFTNEENILVGLLQPAIANLTIAKAFEKGLPLQYSGDGVIVALTSPGAKEQGDRGNVESMDTYMITKLRKSCEDDGEQYLSNAVDYLNKTVSSTVFAAYYGSPLYNERFDVNRKLVDNGSSNSSFIM